MEGFRTELEELEEELELVRRKRNRAAGGPARDPGHGIASCPPGNDEEEGEPAPRATDR